MMLQANKRYVRRLVPGHPVPRPEDTGWLLDHSDTPRYDGLNRPTMQFHWNNARTTWAYDPRGLTNLIRHATSAGTLLDFASYTYDQADNPLTRVTNSTRATWSYDNAGQLQTEGHSALGTFDTFTYDGAGNRTQQARTQLGSLALSTFVYDAAGQLVTLQAALALTTFVFDPNGNLQSENTAPTGTTTYVWDALDRMAGVIAPAGTRTTYAYRYDDLRASQNTGSGVQSLVWDVPGPTGFGDLFEELDASNNLVRAYYRAADLAAQKDGTGSYAFHWLDAGTAQLLSDLNQNAAESYVFSAWGELLVSSGTASTPLAWNGEWGYYSDTGARTWVRARHLDVLRGRWLSQDPIGFVAGPNLYGYVSDDPIHVVDPSGLRRLREYRRPTLRRARTAAHRRGDHYDSILDYLETTVPQAVKDLSSWYWEGLGGCSDWVDDVIFFGAASRAGEVTGRYDSGRASLREVVTADAELGGRIVEVALVSYGAVKLVGFAIRPFTAANQLIVHWDTLDNINAMRAAGAIRPGVWVMTGGATARNYIMAGVGSLPVLQRLIPPIYQFGNNITQMVPRATLQWPSGWEWIKGFLGQRIYLPR